MERSKAVKCPSAGLHLAGTKKVQLYLSQPGVLEKFVKRDVAEKLRELFVGQYTLDVGPDGDNAVSMALQNPEKFVLKPEREGGGYNLYGDDIKNLLMSIQDSDKRSAYILMERINPPLIPNCILRRDTKPEITNIICELGIFGTILGNKEDIFVNNLAGHLLRSKGIDSAECGVAAG
ncbi:glutathione synthetase, partial [Nephila pilipes]